jgi:electron transport complex protein RnfG
MKTYVHLTLILFVIAALSGLILGTVNQLTYEKIEANNSEKIEKGINQIYPEASYEDFKSFKADHILQNLYEVKSEEEVVGYVFNAKAPKAFSGITVLIGLDLEGNVVDVYFVSLKESQKIGDKVALPSFYEQFIGKNTTEDADTISGATVSSNAMINAVKAAQEYFNANIK